MDIAFARVPGPGLELVGDKKVKKRGREKN